MIDVQSIARSLGGRVTGRSSISIPTPGHSRNDLGTSITFDPSAPGGMLVYSFNGGDVLAIKDMVRARLGLPHGSRSRVQFQPGLSPANDDDAERRRAAAIWSEGRAPAGTIIETAYLRMARGIGNLPDVIFSGEVIRFHPACPYKLRTTGELIRLPSMISAMTAIEGGAFQGIHRTALLPDGSGKAKVEGLPDDGRMMLGSSKGAVVRLTPDEDVTEGLGLAEGIETALSVLSAGFAPMWATLSAGTMERFPLLGGIEALTLFADNDESGTGSRAAAACAERWIAAGRECVIWTPPRRDGDGKGTDFNDVLGGTV